METLTWIGPVNLSDFKESNDKSKFSSDNSYEDLKKCGLYLWCIELPDKTYGVYYVGAAPVKSIYKRINEEYWQVENKIVGMYFDLKYSEDKKHIIDFNILMTDNTTDKVLITDEIIKHNIKNTWIFYTAPTEDSLNKIKDTYKVSRPLYELEGALKNILRKNMESRKYYLSMEHPRFGIDYNKIENTFPEGIKIIGL